MLVILKKTVKFINASGYEVRLNEGTEVYLDQKESIAFHNGDHFDLSKDEYSLIN